MLIENRFKTRVYDWYGTSETSVLLFQTIKTYPKYITPNYHCEYKIIEEGDNKIIYGKANWDTLSNLGYYKTNDIAEVDEHGNIIAIKGRTSDIITVADNSVPITNFLTAFYNIPGIVKFQILNSEYGVEFRFVLTDDNQKGTIDKINKEISKRLVQISYSVTFTKPLIKSSGGKTPFFIKTF